MLYTLTEVTKVIFNTKNVSTQSSAVMVAGRLYHAIEPTLVAAYITVSILTPRKERYMYATLGFVPCTCLSSWALGKPASRLSDWTLCGSPWPMLQHHYIPSQQPPVHLLIPRQPWVLSPSSRAAYLINQIISKLVKYGIVHILFFSMRVSMKKNLPNHFHQAHAISPFSVRDSKTDNLNIKPQCSL